MNPTETVRGQRRRSDVGGLPGPSSDPAPRATAPQDDALARGPGAGNFFRSRSGGSRGRFGVSRGPGARLGRRAGRAQEDAHGLDLPGEREAPGKGHVQGLARSIASRSAEPPLARGFAARRAPGTASAVAPAHPLTARRQPPEPSTPQGAKRCPTPPRTKPRSRRTTVSSTSGSISEPRAPPCPPATACARPSSPSWVIPRIRSRASCSRRTCSSAARRGTSVCR